MDERAPHRAHFIAAELLGLTDAASAARRPGDVTADEVVKTLGIAWAAAERWRIEQGLVDGDFVLSDMDDDQAAAPHRPALGPASGGEAS